ncbi:MAG: hypothetical protein AABY13_02305 [Nanoarchaeota archaeon]
MKKGVIVLLAALLLVAGVSAFSFRTLDQDPVAFDNTFDAVVDYYGSSEDTTVRVMIPELDVYDSRGSFGEDDDKRAHFIMELPEGTPSGEYLVRYTISNDDETIHKYRHIIVP